METFLSIKSIVLVNTSKFQQSKYCVEKSYTMSFNTIIAALDVGWIQNLTIDLWWKYLYSELFFISFSMYQRWSSESVWREDACELEAEKIAGMLWSIIYSYIALLIVVKG